MKRLIEKTVNFIVALVSIAFFVATAYIHYVSKSMTGAGLRGVEIVCYVMCALCYVIAFGEISRGFTQVWAKFIFAVFPSALFTAQVIFFNSFLHFIDWNFSWYYEKYNEIRPYSEFLRSDLAYKTGIGGFRYILCFAALYAACSLIIFLSYKGIVFERKYHD